MQLQKVIENLGYTAKEAKVYLAALGLGEAHISDIAEKVKMPRSSVQLIVDKLHQDGVLNFYVMRRYKYWVAEKPERLLAALKRREQAIQDALPALTALREASWGKRKKIAKPDVQQGVFKVMADASSEPVLIANEKIEIVYANEAWERQFGYSLKEIYKENPRIFQSGETPRRVYEEMWRCLKSERMFQSEDIVDKRKDGSLFNLLTTIFPVKHKGEAFYIQVLSDITESKKAEEIKRKFDEVSKKDN